MSHTIRVLAIVFVLFLTVGCGAGTELGTSTPPTEFPGMGVQMGGGAQRPLEARPPNPNGYCNSPGAQGPGEPPTPFLYQPFEGTFTPEIWTAQMDHDKPDYRPNGLIATLGESLRFDASGPGLAGGTEVYHESGTQWFGPGTPYMSLWQQGYYIFGYQSPSFETYLYYDGHDGHDFAVLGKALAAADGSVVFKGDYGNALGRVVEIYHQNGYLTRYAHLASFEEGIEVSSQVKAGQPIGTIGGSAVVDGQLKDNYWGIHLHFSVFRWNGSRWQVTDPFGWDPWAGPDQQSHIKKQREDPLTRCNGEISYNLWVGGWPQPAGEPVTTTLFYPTHDRYVGGWIGDLPTVSEGEIAYIQDGDIWLLNLTTGQTTKLTSDGSNADPAWAPDGEWLTFASNREGNFDIYIMRADGSQVRRLTSDPADEVLPTFSRDGTLYFVRITEDDAVYVVIRLDGETESIVYDTEMPCYPGKLSVATETKLLISEICGTGAGSSFAVSLIELTAEGPKRTFISDYYSKFFTEGPCQNQGHFFWGARWFHAAPRFVFIDSADCESFDSMSSGLTNGPEEVILLSLERTPPESTTIFSGELSQGNLSAFSLDISPDDQWIVMGLGDNGLWIVSTEGGQLRQIFATGTSPAWRPVSALSAASDMPTPALPTYPVLDVSGFRVEPADVSVYEEVRIKMIVENKGAPLNQPYWGYRGEVILEDGNGNIVESTAKRSFQEGSTQRHREHRDFFMDFAHRSVIFCRC